MDISESDIEKVISSIKKKANGELTDEELNEVAGGLVPGAIIVLACIGLLGTIAGITSSC